MTATRTPAPTTPDGALAWSSESSAPTAPGTPPRDATDAGIRFYAKYGATVGGRTWKHVQMYLDTNDPAPRTVEGWIAAAQSVLNRQAPRQTAPAAPHATQAPGDDIAFSGGPARRPVARVADPLLQWSTGLTTVRRELYAGWLVEVEKCPAELNAAMEAAGFQTVTIKHGSGNTVQHWAVETADLFVVAEGVQSIAEMKTTPDRYGIAFGWGMTREHKPQSKLLARVLIRELLQVGYTQPLLLSVKSTLTDDMISALTRQYDVLDAIDALRVQQGKPALNPPFYACSIPIGPGDEVQRGATQKKGIVPMVAHVPNPIGREWLKGQYIRKEWVSLIEGMVEYTVRWSVGASRQIAEGEQGPGEGEV